MKSYTVSILIIVFLCAVNGALFWLLFARVELRNSLTDRYIEEPFTLDLEQDPTYYPLGAKVSKCLKTLIITDYPSEEGLSTYKEILHYNKRGKVTKRSVYRNNTLDSEWLFKYDDKGNRIADEQSTSLSHTIYQYDGKGNRIGWIYYDYDGKLVSQAALKYDKENRLVEELRWNASGRGREMYRYCYHNGLLSQYLYYNPPGNFCKRRIYIYDKDGRNIEWLDWYSGRKWAYAEGRVVYLYNNKGNLIERTRYSSGGYFRDRITYQYDDKGNKIEERIFPSDKPEANYFGRTYQYNEDGYPIKASFYIVGIDPETKKEYRSEGGPTVFEYEFYPEPEK